jgi:hypothetical protein
MPKSIVLCFERKKPNDFHRFAVQIRKPVYQLVHREFGCHSDPLEQ